MKTNGIHIRARLNAIMQLITEEKGGDRTIKNNHSVLLRNGIIPDGMKDRYDIAFNKQYKALLKGGNKQPISFSELSRFDTWFRIHPEKVAGKEVITTSREFPISIKGSETDILTTISKTLQPGKKDRVRIARVKADAKLKLLKLMKI